MEAATAWCDTPELQAAMKDAGVFARTHRVLHGGGCPTRPVFEQMEAANHVAT